MRENFKGNHKWDDNLILSPFDSIERSYANVSRWPFAYEKVWKINNLLQRLCIGRDAFDKGIDAIR